MSGEFETEIHEYPEFFDRLRSDGALDAWGAVDSETEIEGLVYHHRGVQVPSYDGKFAWEPEGERPFPTFSIELGAVGSRNAWSAFDATRSWNVYLVLFEGGAVVAWMTDAEFEADEADQFPTKHAAIRAGNFSFGFFFRFGPDWVEREEWALESSAPGLVQLGDGRLLTPENKSEFYGTAGAVPTEFRPAKDEAPPDYLGLVDARLTADPDP